MTRHHAYPLSIGDALAQSIFWLILASGFGVFIYLSFQYNLFSMVPADIKQLSGNEALSQYFSIYFIERLLSFDNLFVIFILFQTLNIPAQEQYRVLLYGFIIAILVRVLLISLGVNLMEYYPWLHYLISLLLLLSAVKLVANFALPLTEKHQRLSQVVSEKLPLDPTISRRFFLKKAKRFYVTPLLVGLLCIEYTDFVFSLDSIPAALSISNNTAIILSASLFALLGLRSLYFVFAHALTQLRYIKFSILSILILMALRSALYDIYSIGAHILLLMISIIILIGIGFSLWHQDRDTPVDMPFAGTVNRIYQLTYTGFRRLIVTLVGISVIIVGIIMIVTPGPAIIVIPAGIAILATEFVWARLLLKKIKEKLIHYSKESKSFFKRNNENDR